MAVIIISMVTTVKFSVQVTGTGDGKQTRQLVEGNLLPRFMRFSANHYTYVRVRI
jgi:hypothetical protein